MMILDLLKKRCSVRRFSSRQVSEDVIQYILEAGRLSPSGGNEQAWMFGVITDNQMISQIAQLSYNQKWIATAPLLVVLVTKIVEDQRGARDIQLARFPHLADSITAMDKEFYSSLNLEEHQTKIPGTHMVLAALEHGIGSTWVSYFDVPKINKLLGLPEMYLASEILAFGYPAGEPKPHKKKPLTELVFRDKYNQG